MALIKCSECGGMVSDKAEVCPHCGAPIKHEEQINESQSDQVVETAANVAGDKKEPINLSQGTATANAPKQAKKKNKKVIIISAIVIIIVALIGIRAYNNHQIAAEQNAYYSNMKSYYNMVYKCTDTTRIQANKIQDNWDSLNGKWWENSTFKPRYDKMESQYQKMESLYTDLKNYPDGWGSYYKTIEETNSAVSSFYNQVDSFPKMSEDEFSNQVSKKYNKTISCLDELSGTIKSMSN